MADQLSAFDLDALERVVEAAKAESFGSLAFSMDTVVIDTLIRRVRVAEGEVARWQSGSIHRHYVEDQARIAQLERVRKAAGTVDRGERMLDVGPRERRENLDNLREALEAIEEPRLTENSTVVKAGNDV